MRLGLLEAIKKRFDDRLSADFAGGYFHGQSENAATYPHLVVVSGVANGPAYNTGSWKTGGDKCQELTLIFKVYSKDASEALRLGELVERAFVEDVNVYPLIWLEGNTMGAALVGEDSFEDPDKDSDGSAVWAAVKNIEFQIQRT